MSPLAYHIIAATGIKPAEPSTEPPATRGDWGVGFTASITAMALVAMIWAGWVQW